MDGKSLEKFQYYLMPSTTPPPEYVELHDELFDFWMSIWQKTLAELKYDPSHLHDDFVRQNAISCITYDNKVIACLLFSFFNVESKAANSFSYFKNNYTDLFIPGLKKLGVRNAMAMQYMAIDPKWRGKFNPPIHSALALAGLSIRALSEFNMDAGIAPMRKDHKVNELYYSHGADCIVADHISHNAPCDLVAAVRWKTHAHQNPEIRTVHDTLWDNRIDLVSGKKPASLDKTKVG